MGITPGKAPTGMLPGRCIRLSTTLASELSYNLCLQQRCSTEEIYLDQRRESARLASKSGLPGCAGIASASLCGSPTARVWGRVFVSACHHQHYG